MNVLLGNQVQNKKKLLLRTALMPLRDLNECKILSIYFQSALKQVTGGWILFQHHSGNAVGEELEGGVTSQCFAS